MAQAASQSSAAPLDESPTSTLSAAAHPFCPVDPCKLQTVVLADHAHVLLTLDSSHPPVHSLPSAKLQTGADLSQCLRECVASTLGVFPSSFGDVGSHRHTTLVDNACVHHVFVPPARFPLHRLRHVMTSMIQCCSSSRPPRPVVLVPWSQLDEPSIILDSHARSLISMLRPHLDTLQRKIRLPVCALVPPAPRGLADAEPVDALPCYSVSSVLLLVTRWSQGQHQVLLYARSGQLNLLSIEPEPGEPPLAAVVRLIKRYFVEPDAASRSVRLSQVWRGHALSATSFGYHLALPRPSIMATASCHWVWTSSAVVDALAMTPSERKVVMSVLRTIQQPRPRRQSVVPPHVTATPCWFASLWTRPDIVPTPQRTRAPTLAPVFEEPARAVAVASFSHMQCRLDGAIDFDRDLLDRLVQASCDRARSRGTLKVTPRDVREAAQTLIVTRRRSDARDDSPAEELPRHYDTLLSQLRTLREDTEHAKFGGSRAVRVLVVGETSGVIASMFTEAGADVVTCDLHKRTTDDTPTPHFQGDASLIQDLGWDLVVCHPPCTYLSNAGVQYLHTEPGRYERMLEAVSQFKRQHDTIAPFVCVEQPKIHRYAKQELGGLEPSQYVHPWQHGTGQTKPTALYLSEGLPPLTPTCLVPGRERSLAKLPNSVTRGERRSRTFIGIAGAMALQWMPILSEYASAHPDDHTAQSLVTTARKSQQLTARPPRWVAPVCTYSIDEQPRAPSPSPCTTRPWELPRPALPIPTLPVVQLRRTRGRWRALEPSGPAGAPAGYIWQPLLLADHKAVDDIVSHSRRPVAYTGLQGLLKGVSTQANQMPRWKQSSTDLTLQLDQQRQQIENAKANVAFAHDPVRIQAHSPRRPPSSCHPGLRTIEERPLALHPPCRSASEYVSDYQNRFVSAATPPLVAASVPIRHDSAPSATCEVDASASQIHELANPSIFGEDDIVSPPPPLPFVTNAAYITEFAVARHAGTRQGKDTLFSIGKATCAIKESISDTGAGPSLVGSLLLSRLPADAAVSRSQTTPTVNSDLVGPDGQPLVSRGSVSLVFTLSGHPFRHDFLVIEGGDLLLLGNDFLARYRATVEPFGKDEKGAMRLQVELKGKRRQLSVPLSCAASPLPAVSAPVRTRRRCCPVPLRAPREEDTGPNEEILTSEHPALVPIDDPSPPVTNLDPTTSATTPLEHVTSQIVTDEYLLYSKSAFTLPPRAETTVWLPMPHAHRHRSSPVLVDRIPAKHGMESEIPVACSLSTPDSEGLIPVRLINVLYRTSTVPASFPVARCLVDYEVKAPGALNPDSDDAYERLSAEQRAVIDSITVDEHSRLTDDQRRRVRSLLAKHIRAFAMNPKDPAHTHLMEVELPLEEGAKPHRHAASRLGEAGQAIVDAHVAEMEANGIIRKSNSQWGSRVVLVKKKSGEIRFCIDFRDLNRKLLTLDSPIPRCDEAIDRLASGAGSQDSLFLSTIDLAAGFWTLPIKESDKSRTAFVTHRQKYEWNYLPFGVQSGPSYMCRLMDAALQGLAWEVCMPYLDDVGVWSTGVGPTPEARELASFEQMLTRLDLVLERLAWAGMTAKASKCVLFATSASYLGHVISRRGLEMETAKIDKIRAIDPTSVNTLERVRSFVGLCSYYRRFVKGFAAITAPLADLTKNGVDVGVESQKPAVQLAITTLIHCMTTEPVILRMPRFDRLFMVKTDAAQTEGLGGVLSQKDDEGHEKVVAYYGRRLTTPERNYTVTEIELLAALESIRTWRPYLWGRRFLLIVDHAALRWLHTMKDTIEGGPASRLMRWNMKLMEYNFEVLHKPGRIHSDADAVSRLVAALRRPTSLLVHAPSKRTAAAAISTAPAITQGDRRQPCPGLQSSRVAFYEPMTLKAYCLRDRQGGLDLPGGVQAPGDSAPSTALLRSCDEEITLPAALWERLQAVSLGSTPPLTCQFQQDEQQHTVSLFMVPASRAELDAVLHTPSSDQGYHDPAVRPLADIARDSPYKEALESGIASVAAPRFRALPAPPTPTQRLAALRRSLQNWALQTGVNEDSFEAARTGVTAAVWSGAPTALHLGSPSPTPCGAALRPRRTQVVTSRSLLAADRVARLADTTRRSIIDSYLTTEVPTVAALREAQANDPDCATLRSYFTTGCIGPIVDSTSHRRAVWAAREARHLRIHDDGLIVRVDPVQPSTDAHRSTPVPSPRPYIPSELRHAYLYAFHEQLGHVGTTAMLKALRLWVYWPGMTVDVRDHVSKCHECNATRSTHRSAVHPVRPTVGSYPFDSVICDICDMVESHDGRFSKIIVFADSLSRWVEVIPWGSDPTSAEVLDAFTAHVACRYGWPRELRADGGSNLANKLAEAIHERTGVQLLKGAKYHPQSQGIAERVQGTLTQMCVAANEGGSHWPDHLPFLLFSYRATPHRVTEMSPAMVLYGRELRLPSTLDMPERTPTIDDLPADIQAYAQRQHLLLSAAWHAARQATVVEQEKAFSDAHSKHQSNVAFEVGDRVRYLLPDAKANKLTSAWSTPCRILEVLGQGNYRLRDLPNNMMDDKFHVSQLRPYLTEADAEPLSADEYVVDRIIDHRGNQLPTRTYKIKWRQYPLSQATWEPRQELLRRCEELVSAYDLSRPPDPEPPPRVRNTPNTESAAGPSAPVATTPLPSSSVPSADLPHRALFERGKWRYVRNVSTPRGLKERFFEATTFTTTELDSDHFRGLREACLTMLPRAIAAVIAACDRLLDASPASWLS